MATTYRLDPTLATQLQAEARRTKRSQNSLVNEAVERLLRGSAPKNRLNDLIIPPTRPYSPVPASLQVDPLGQLDAILAKMRTDER